MVAGKLDGRLQNPFQEKYFVQIDEEYGFWGKLDECLINKKNEYIPVDFKTSSSDPREKEVLAAYQSQIDAYTYIISRNNKPIAGYGYLIFVYPDLGRNLHEGFPMIIHIQKLTGDPKKTEKRIAKAIEVIEGKIPPSSPSCNFCNWHTLMNAELKEGGKNNRKKPASRPGENLQLALG
jgi:hypothetical protein